MPQQSITQFMTRRSARNDAKSKGSESPTKQETTTQKKGKVADTATITPRKSSRQATKETPKSEPEKAKDTKVVSTNKKVSTPNKNAETVTPIRSSRSANSDSTKKAPFKASEPSKASKTKPSTKPVNPIDLIDELQGIEDFLRESTNETKTPEKKSPEKSDPSSPSKTTKSKEAKIKETETNKSVTNTGKEESKSNETTTDSTIEDKLGDEFDIEADAETGTKRKAESIVEKPSKIAKIEKSEKPVSIIDKNRNVNNIENTSEPVRVFVAPEIEYTDESKLTDGKCGDCVNCHRKPCYECSNCKREEFNNCIDMYCLNQRDHRDQRQAMRELYLQARQQNSGSREKKRSQESENGGAMEQENTTNSTEVSSPKKDSIEESEILESIKSKKTDGGNVKARFSDQGVIFEIETTESESEDEELTIEQKIDKVMARIVKSDNKMSPEKLQTLKSKVSKTITEKYSADKKEVQNKERKKNRTDYVYGGSSKAKKVRRCGECEGCTRDDCGKCIGCLDKPKFGGKNTRKQACTMRKCRMK